MSDFKRPFVKDSVVIIAYLTMLVIVLFFAQKVCSVMVDESNDIMLLTYLAIFVVVSLELLGINLLGGSQKFNEARLCEMVFRAFSVLFFTVYFVSKSGLLTFGMLMLLGFKLTDRSDLPLLLTSDSMWVVFVPLISIAYSMIHFVLMVGVRDYLKIKWKQKR